MKLYVWENGVAIGILETTPDRGECFQYTENAMHRISISLPLDTKMYSKKECLPFFSGLLPDGDQRERMARSCHVSSESVMKLLAHFGRDIAGSLSILEEGEIPNTIFDYVPISTLELEAKIQQAGQISLFANANQNIRMSLAGAMDKIPLFFKEDKWFLPVGDAPSNVIIKPNDRYSANEYLCTSLAKACGIPTPEIFLTTFGSEEAFVSKRFDREERDGRLQRIHQEDFCQALGINPERKYEEDGGPGYKECLSMIWSESSLPVVDYRRFLEICVFNYLIGNCDAHGKNFSFLYQTDREKVRLSPFYDLVSSTIYPEFSRNMAMKAGKHKDIDKITKEDLLAVDKGSRLMETILKQLPRRLESALQAMEKGLDPKLKSLFGHIAMDTKSRIRKIQEA